VAPPLSPRGRGDTSPCDGEGEPPWQPAPPFSHSSWVVTRRGLTKPVSSSPPFKTGLAAFTAPGLAPSILLRDPHAPRSVPSHFLSIHSTFPVDSLRVRCVPLFQSFRRLGAFAVSPHPGVRGFPTCRLLRPIRLPMKASAFHTALAFLLPPALASFLRSPVFPM
jgi:hypothetical protein